MIAPDTLLQNRYLVVEQIGHGGMGAVYRATDQRFGSVVALKETFFDDPSLRKAFEREAHLLNRLRHPALPRVSDHFNESDGQFLVMEFIPGEDLAEMLEKRGTAFPLEQVLVWADQLLDALDYLHTHEPPVIHRDIKPQNLKLTARNQIVLLDFGLAKGTPVTLSRASLTGSVFGYSRNYAPLEQMQGTGTDTRSDIYSLAATLYHLLTGAVPPDALTRAMATVNGQPDPLQPANEVHAQVTPSIALALSKAMRQGAAQRFQTAEEMRAALREAARRIEDERAATVIATTAGLASLQDQETQLMGGARTDARRSADPTRADDPGSIAAAPANAADAGRATNVVSGQEAATLISPAHTSPTGANPQPAAATDAADSVVTTVGHTRTAPRGRSLSGRTLGAAASVVILLAVAGAFYAYMRRDPAQHSSQEQSAPQQQPTSATTPEPQQQQPSAQTVVESAQPTTPPSTAAAAAPAPQTQSRQPSASARNSKRAGAKSAGEDDAEEKAEAAQERDEPEVQEPDIPDPPAVMSPQEREELRRLPRRVRRIVQAEQRRALILRQRALEEERRQRRRQQQPYPPE